MTIKTRTRYKLFYSDIGYKDFIYKPYPQCHSFETSYRKDPNTYPTNICTFSETINTVNSPNYAKKKKVYVTFRPKKPLLPPRRPELNLPQLPATPRRRERESLQSWQRRYSNWLVLNQKVMRRRKERLESYHNALKRYEKRYARYQQYLSWCSMGRPTVKRTVNRLARIHNPYTKTSTEYSPPIGSYKTENGYRLNCRSISQQHVDSANVLQTTLITGHVGPFVGLVWTGYTDVLNRLLSKADSTARNKLRSNMNDQQVHVGNLIAERHQTIKMLKDIVTRVKNLTPRNILKNYTSKKLSNDTLAYFFGIKPLINDAYGVGQAIARLSVGEKDKIIVRGSSTQNTEELVYDADSLSAGFPVINNKLNIKLKVTVNYVCEYEIDNGALTYLNGIGLINPAEVAWEVMPWSFVVDWFLPIGNYIKSLSSEIGLKFITGSRTEKYELELLPVSTALGKMYPPSYYNRWSGTWSGRKLIKSQTRTVLTASPCVQFPDFKNPYSSYHLIESLALLRQRFK